MKFDKEIIVDENNSENNRPKRLLHPKLFILEGNDDVNVIKHENFKEYFHTLALDKNIKDLSKKEESFVTNVIQAYDSQKPLHIKIIMDSEGNKNETETSIYEFKKNFSSSSVKIDKFINDPMLEVLFLKSWANDSLFNCVKEYFKCLNKKDDEKDFYKKKCQVFLASRSKDYCGSIGFAADRKKNYVDFNSQHFSELKTFLTNWES